MAWTVGPCTPFEGSAYESASPCIRRSHAGSYKSTDNDVADCFADQGADQSADDDFANNVTDQDTYKKVQNKTFEQTVEIPAPTMPKEIVYDAVAVPQDWDVGFSVRPWTVEKKVDNPVPMMQGITVQEEPVARVTILFAPLPQRCRCALPSCQGPPRGWHPCWPASGRNLPISPTADGDHV